MIGKMARVMAYRHAPRAAANLLHPAAAARIAHTKYDLKHAYAPRISAVGAALVAVPFGFVLGRLMAGSGDHGRTRLNRSAVSPSVSHAQNAEYVRQSTTEEVRATPPM
jgi:hypothetical protein